jgi:hypothetical protein
LELRWLRGEFATRTDARAALGVRTIVEDSNVYDQLKLLARFVRLAGYAGLVVELDEMVNVYKLSHTKSRNDNYEQILRILNDGLKASRRARLPLEARRTSCSIAARMCNYAALQSRLAENTFATEGLVDFSGPVLRLASLTPEDFFVLLTKVRHVHATGDPSRYLMPDEALKAFMDQCARRLGDECFRTPRTIITAFVNLLAVLEQNPNVPWQQLVGQLEIAPETNPDLEPPPAEGGTDADDDQLASFKL